MIKIWKLNILSLTSDRSPETYENVKNCLVGDDAGDLQLGDEGREDCVGGGQRTKILGPVKSVKEIRKF